MIKLSEFDLKKITGGFNFNASFINSCVKIFNVLIEIGRNIGSSASRVKNKNYCP